MNVQVSAPLKRLNHLQCETNVVYSEMSSVFGQSDSVMQILYTICDSGGECCLLRDICHLTSLPKQTINSALRKLEEEQVVYLEHVGRKNKRVCLTEKGKELAAQTAGKVIEAENRILAEWGSEIAEQFLALNERYLECLQKELKRLKDEHEKQVKQISYGF